jgi:hypothetical protein
MTREEAGRRATELNDERAEGDAGTWIVTQTPEGDWRPVRVAGPGFKGIHPLKATVEAKPRPRDADDPRPSTFRDVPPYGGGL